MRIGGDDGISRWSGKGRGLNKQIVWFRKGTVERPSDEDLVIETLPNGMLVLKRYAGGEGLRRLPWDRAHLLDVRGAGSDGRRCRYGE